jgi:hypothetical protein
MGGASMFILYIALSVAGVAILAFAVKVCKIILDRRYYENQGIVFIKTYPFIGSEVDVTDLIGKTKRETIYTWARIAPTLSAAYEVSISNYTP